MLAVPVLVFHLVAFMAAEIAGESHNLIPLNDEDFSVFLHGRVKSFRCEHIKIFRAYEATTLFYHSRATHFRL